jgi:transcriptional regulator with XRE-family HTH domain
MDDDEVTARFRDTIRAERERRGMTQSQLAAVMTEHGVPARWSTIAKIEAGDRGVPIGEAAAIADAFGVSLSRLVGRRARPVGDRDYAARLLAESVDDGQRAWRVALRDIADRCAELADVDEQGKFAAAITAVQDACDKLIDDVGALAQAGGQIAETRGGGAAVWKAVRVQKGRGDA